MENGKSKVTLAVLVSVSVGKVPPEVTREHLEELAFLAETAGITTVNQVIQNLPHPDVRTFVGKGKLEELKTFVKANGVTNVIFDDDLSPSQLRNLEREFNPGADEPQVRVY